MDLHEVEKIWSDVKEELLKTLPESSHPWINSFEATGYAGGVFTVITGLSMAVSIVRKSHLKEIQEAFKKVTGDDVDFEIILDKETANKIKKTREKILSKIKSAEEKSEKTSDYLTQIQGDQHY